MILLVESCQNHVLFVALKGLFYARDAAFHLLLLVPLDLLPFFGHDVKGKAQEGHGDADSDYGKAYIVKDFVHQHVRGLD